MVCPLRIIVVAVSALVAVILAILALMANSEESRSTEAEERRKGSETQNGGWWAFLDFFNGKYLYRQYKRWNGKATTKTL